MHSDRDLRDQLLNALGVRPDSVLRTGSADKTSAPADEPPGAGQHSPDSASARSSQLDETIPSLHDVMLREVDEAVYENAGTRLVRSLVDTLGERGKRYGDFTDNANVSQSLKSIIRQWEDENIRPVHSEALEMIAQKMARILNGDPEYKDNWHDIQGYARLAEEACKEGGNGQVD